MQFGRDVVLQRAVVEVLIAVGEEDAEHLGGPPRLGQDALGLGASEAPPNPTAIDRKSASRPTSAR